ncbi:MAG: hypothetical protein KGL46_10830 [Hyphomicrobiales bacterium]|nr:hypothetical protein [Hyphomicrobiales bacterium]
MRFPTVVLTTLLCAGAAFAEPAPTLTETGRAALASSGFVRGDTTKMAADFAKNGPYLCPRPKCEREVQLTLGTQPLTGDEMKSLPANETAESATRKGLVKLPFWRAALQAPLRQMEARGKGSLHMRLGPTTLDPKTATMTAQAAFVSRKSGFTVSNAQIVMRAHDNSVNTMTIISEDRNLPKKFAHPEWMN